MRTLLAGLLIALYPATSWAEDWYVDDDADLALGDGSAANPFATIQSAITVALGGGIANWGTNASMGSVPSGTLSVSHSAIAYNDFVLGYGRGLYPEGNGDDVTLDHTVVDPTDHAASEHVTQILGALTAGATEAGDALICLRRGRPFPGCRGVTSPKGDTRLERRPEQFSQRVPQNPCRASSSLSG